MSEIKKDLVIDSYADLGGAALRNVDLSGANLYGANLDETIRD